MRAQSAIDVLPQGAALGVVIDSFRMEEACHAVGTPIPPGLGNEALVQVALHALQQGIVLLGVQELLGPLHLLELSAVGAPDLGACELPGPTLRHLRSAKAPQRQEWLELCEQAALLPLELDPRRIPDDQVE